MQSRERQPLPPLQQEQQQEGQGGGVEQPGYEQLLASMSLDR